jgi:hypothetical protein
MCSGQHRSFVEGCAGGSDIVDQNCHGPREHRQAERRRSASFRSGVGRPPHPRCQGVNDRETAEAADLARQPASRIDPIAEATQYGPGNGHQAAPLSIDTVCHRPRQDPPCAQICVVFQPVDQRPGRTVVPEGANHREPRWRATVAGNSHARRAYEGGVTD